ncbi:MAG: 2,3-dihydro-2,3-dihydroxybenzoate dehydrogenase [Alphaproteobacteria bacterium MarineAlpha2_Bin1]|nr:MAG: 2,3-dihydro-2,3-dihydroxybenzoate dehydrogenase [Alphaproteobacteria bacterium MarineAlpha2_Bin1]|tara:strand:+ start:61 stop:852 length:792 start_codon:yes stop_codon:yes gene_type:complete
MAIKTNLNNKTAIITGGSKGIGWETAKLMISDGMNVVLISRSEKLLQSRLDELGQFRRQIRIFPCDLTIPNSTEEIAKYCFSEFKVIDVLVNSAGAAKGGIFSEILDKDWEDSFNLKFFGTIRIIRSVVPYMKDQRDGRIVNVIGDTGKKPNKLMLPGSSVNAALLSLTKGLAEELGEYGIRINAVSPGPTKTERIVNMFNSLAKSTNKTIKEIEAEFLNENIIKKLADPKEIANLILFLSSDVSSNITGTTITSDGGRSKYI